MSSTSSTPGGLAALGANLSGPSSVRGSAEGAAGNRTMKNDETSSFRDTMKEASQRKEPVSPAAAKPPAERREATEEAGTSTEPSGLPPASAEPTRSLPTSQKLLTEAVSPAPELTPVEHELVVTQGLSESLVGIAPEALQEESGTDPDLEVALDFVSILAPTDLNAKLTPVEDAKTGSIPLHATPLRSFLTLTEGSALGRSVLTAPVTFGQEPQVDFQLPVLEGTKEQPALKTFSAPSMEPGLGLGAAERSRLAGLPVQLQIQLEQSGATPEGELASQPVLGPEFGSLLSRPPAASVAGSASASDALGALTQDGMRTAVPVSVTFGHEKWHQLAAERTVTLLQQGVQSAELMLDPPELGPLQVRIQVQNDQAVVHFSSANAAVRDALDQTIPRLREMLQEQGMSLLQAGVSDQSSGQSSERNQGDGTETVADAVVDPLASADEVPRVVMMKSGIDDFA